MPPVSQTHRNTDEHETKVIPLPLTRREHLRTVGIAGMTAVAGCTEGETNGGESSSGGSIEVTPAESLVDEQLTIDITGFAGKTKITVWAKIKDSAGQTWLSYGRFETDENGTVDVGAHAPIDGTYSGVDPMGLLWSMRVQGRPEASYLDDESMTIQFGVQQNQSVIDTAEIRRYFVAPEVTRTPVADDELVGVLFEPSGKGPHPGVLVLHGSDGELPFALGALLSAHGYAALALQYFSPTGENDLPTDLAGIPLEYCDRAIDWLRSHPAVVEGPVGVVGDSKGGELALLVGAHSPYVGAVVGYVPSGVVWQGMDATGMVVQGSSWTRNGDDVPFAPIVFGGTMSDMIDLLVASIRGRPLEVEGMYRDSYHQLDDDQLEAAMIPVENIDGPVLVISGSDDKLWPSPLLSEIAVERLAAHDHEYTYEHRTYEDAGHFITAPYQPTAHSDVWEGLKLGGTPRGNAAAAADSWPRVLEMLSRGLQ